MSEEEIGEKVQWIEDGHVLHFRIDHDDIYISHVQCPFREKVSLCNRMRDNCVVDTYVGVYGTEVNIGSTTLDGPLEIAWVPVLGESDLDREFIQIWIIPVTDPDYVTLKMLNPDMAI
jgi:hypothetical protein